MSRTREWLKFGSLVGVALVSAVGFATVVDLPRRPLAAQQPQTEIFRKQAPAPVDAAQPVVDLGNAFAAAAEAVQPAVVYIRAERSVAETQERPSHPQLPAPFDRFFEFEGPEVQPQPRSGQGSGFLISSDGYIMTNNHVVEGFDRLNVRLFDGREFTARVVGRDADTDVAVIKIDGSNLPAVALGDSDSLRVGEWVLAIGTPLGDAFSFTVTAGIVSGRGRRLDGLQRSQWAISDFIQTDAAINPGNSGGPLVNIRGQVVGMNAAIASRTGYYAGYSFAIPVNLASVIGDQLIRDGKVTRAALGVHVANATAEDAEYVGMPDVRGVVVHDFPAGSPAQDAGLEQGDVIVQLDGQRVDYVAQLQQIVGFKRPGDHVAVTVVRPGNVERTINVRLTTAGGEEETRVARAEPRDEPEEVAYEAKLGVQLGELSSESATSVRRFNSDMQGLIIEGVDPNGPARNHLAPANAQRGYIPVITHVNGQRVRTMSELSQTLSGLEPGAVVSLRLFEVTGETTRSRVVRFRTGG
jgi:serine protease Do